MKRYLAISIDVEPDCSATWQYSNPLTFTGVTDGIGKILQPLFLKYSMVPTYLLNNVVLEDESSIRVLKQLDGKFELGTHLHPEFIGPGKEHHNYAGKTGRANCCFYPPDIERAKIRNITSIFEDCFGYKPQSFRAGRYSAGGNTIASLADFGYKVDTSVTPHIRWDDATREEPVDFSDAFEQPYFIKEGSIKEADTKGRLLQVPVTIGTFKRNTIRELLVSLGGIRHPYRSEKPVWLRPFYSNAMQMIKLVERFTEQYEHRETVVFNMMFHNVEVLPGLSPYTKTKEDCSRYIMQLEEFFLYCNQNGIRGIGLSELYHAFRN